MGCTLNKYKVQILIVLSVLFVNSAFALRYVRVDTLSPDSTNFYAEYTIIARTTDSDDAVIEGNVDSIYVKFNNSTVIPSSIDPAYIKVKDITCSAVDVFGQVIRILSPKTIGKDKKIKIVIDAAAKIRNPSTAGDYTIQMKTTTDESADNVYNTPTKIYTIYEADTKVSPAAVTPNPSIAEEAAQYTISFNTGAAGYLTANTGELYLVFPSSTTIPSGSISGVTVNGTSANAVSDGDTIIVTTPVDIDNESAVTVKFAVGSGLENPSTAGDYTIKVKTTSESDLVTSDSYTISAAGDLTITGVSSLPDTVNQNGEFSFNIRLGSSGALTANMDTIYVVFPYNTYLPQDLSALSVSISSDGYNDNASYIEVSKSSAADGDTVKIVPPFDISNSADASITFGQSSGYLNPSISGNYSIKLKTSQETAYTASNLYAVGNTATKVSPASVSATSYSTDDETDYTVEFSVGHYGRLVPDSSTITLKFDKDYTISTNKNRYDACTITAASGSAVSIPTDNIEIDDTNNLITIKIPSGVQINNGDNVKIYIGDSSRQPITNPSDRQYCTIDIKTSVEPYYVSSAQYHIGGRSVTINSVTLSDTTVNDTAQYTFNIEHKKYYLEENDNITIVFPEGTILPDSISASEVTIDGDTPNDVLVTPSNRTIKLVLGADMANLTFDIVFSSACAIVNPVVPDTSFYKVSISTSKNKISADSSPYHISGDNTQVTSTDLIINPSVAGAEDVVYSATFTTSSTGKISGGEAAGSSTITIDFDNGTIVPASISASTVEVNSTPCTDVTVDASGAGGIITVTLPNGLTIGNNSEVTLNFTESAGLDNGSSSGTYKVAVKTSSDTTYSSTSGTDGDYTITATQPFAVNSVSNSPATQNANASYSIKFTVGSSGALTAGSDTISIVFPDNTYLPSVISKDDITVNGTKPTVAPIVGHDTLYIVTPVNVANTADVTVLVNQTAGILNPTTVQNYTLKVLTDYESGTSPNYAISQTSTTVSAADVSLSDAVTGTESQYTVKFNTGDNGRLISGSSTITITFGSETAVSGTISNYTNSTISVNGGAAVSISSSISVSGNNVTITVPSSVSVGNNAEVSILLADDSTNPITNPSAEGDYQLSVKTSVETSSVSSNTYTVSDAGPVSSVSNSLGNSMVNAVSSYTITFTVASSGGALSAANDDQITITFPDNTFIPASITASYITVNSTSTTTVSTNPSSREIVINTPVDISNGDNVTVVIASGAGIENPSITGDYTLEVNTTPQPVNATSASYSLTDASSSVTDLSIDISPDTPSETATYQFDFKTGAYGRLVSGSSKIYLLIPKDADFTLGTPPTSKVTVNATAADAVVLNESANSTDEDTLIVTVPTSVTVGNQTDVTVIIDESAGLQNASTTSALTYTVYTSVENTELSGDHSLPVELASFTAEDNKGKVILNWVTESETNNAYWIIKRALSSDKDNFEEIARIDGAGNTSAKTEYTYIDDNIDVNTTYIYSLNSVSVNGRKVEESNIEITTRKPMNFELAQNYPNPFNGGTTIRFTLPTDAKVKITIYNILGQKVAVLANREYETGYHQVHWDGKNNLNTNAATGLYIYVMESKNFRAVKKMLYMK